VVFLAIAAQFVFLAAEFVGVVQLLIYAGAISILIIFAIMLTRDVQRGNLPNRMQLPAVLISSLLLVTFVFVFIDTDWQLIQDFPHRQEILNQAFVNTPARIAVLLMGNYALAFLSAGLLLLGSIIGALALVRERS
jgi:NADH-quinone oxidoreductase subunit J